MVIKVVYYVLLTALLSAAAATDIRKRTIPNMIPLLILAAGAARVAAGIINGENTARTMLSAAGGAFIGAALMILPALKSNLGGGDVKLSGAAGLGIGFPYILHFLLISLTLAALYGILRVIKTRRTGKAGNASETTLPLAPFMLCGAVCMLVNCAISLFL
ncbi:MAG: prepilin peptidase [Clostridia bacterium]|nr:prepilin peptidase [Clostridia bacterium]